MSKKFYDLGYINITSENGLENCVWEALVTLSDQYEYEDIEIFKTCNRNHYASYRNARLYKFCPYCGKPLKIKN